MRCDTRDHEFHDMLRLLHTADVHMDAPLQEPAEAIALGGRLRQRLREFITSLMDRARVWPADAVLIAGDLFDNRFVTQETVAFLTSAFASIEPIPLLITTGNADAAVEDSPYVVDVWPENVHVFAAAEWRAYRCPNTALTVHGFGCDGSEIPANALALLDVEDGGRTHVALIHGRLASLDDPEIQQERLSGQVPAVNVAALEGSRVSYVALGHEHVFRRIETAGTPLACYPGSPLAQGFDDSAPRFHLEVTLSDRTPSVTQVPCEGPDFAAYTINCTAFQSAADLTEAIRALGLSHPGQWARVTLTGHCGIQLRGQLARVRGESRPAFGYLSLEDVTMPDDGIEPAALDGTSLGRFKKALDEAIHDAQDPEKRTVLARARDLGLAAFHGVALDPVDEGGE